MQLTAAKEEADRKAKKIDEDLRHECLAFYFCLCSLNACLAYNHFFVEYQHQALA